MKKYTHSVLLALALAAAMLTACGGSGPQTAPETAPVRPSVTLPEASGNGADVTETVRETETVDPETEQAEPTLPERISPAEQAGEEPSGAVSDPVGEAPSRPEPVIAPISVPEEAVADSTAVEVLLEEEAVALSGTPAALPVQVSAVASGTKVKENGQAVIDYSNTVDGYVMARFKANTDKRLKAQVKGLATTYTYNLTAGSWAVFPLSDGNGSYQITVYQSTGGSKYAAVISATVEVALKDEFAPFLHANQYVNYDAAPNTVAKAKELIGTVSDPLRQVEEVYDFVVKGMTYDTVLASSVKSGYLPDLDAVLAKKSGICFDYAALMTGMLRSQGVPCKLVVGYAGAAYHAWINVWVPGSGWVDGVIWFDGAKWQRMDPTFASSAGSSDSIMAYIGDGANYTAKYFY